MKKNSIIKSVALGATITAAIAGTYFLYGSKNASKNRRKVKSWMLKARGEILERLENISEVNENIYRKIVKDVSEEYQALKNIDKKDIAEFVDELKGHWKNIAKELKVSNKK
jgi:hypothetical protein